MIKTVQIVGNLAGVLGLALALVSGAARMAHVWYLGGVEAPTLFSLGVGFMVLACLAKLHELTAARH